MGFVGRNSANMDLVGMARQKGLGCHAPVPHPGSEHLSVMPFDRLLETRNYALPPQCLPSQSASWNRHILRGFREVSASLLFGLPLLKVLGNVVMGRL